MDSSNAGFMLPRQVPRQLFRAVEHVDDGAAGMTPAEEANCQYS